MRNPIKFYSSVCKRAEDEDVVVNDLAVTPSQMMELTKQGYGISGQNLRLLNAADPADSDFYVPMQYRRGVDISDIYNRAADMREKFKSTMQDVDDGKIQPITKTE